MVVLIRVCSRSTRSALTLVVFFLMIPPPPRSTLFPYTTLFRSLPPEEPERVHTHPHPGGAAPDGLLVEGSERLETLPQPQLLEVGRTRGGGGLRHVRVHL